VIIVALLWGGSQSARAISEEEKRALVTHAANLAAAEKHCHQMIVTVPEFFHLLARRSLGIDLETEPYSTYFMEEVARVDRVVIDMGSQAACDALYDRYGPEGKVASGVMVRR
jgi:ATP-dependent Zn protease